VAYDAPAHGETPGRQTNLPELTAALLAVADGVGPVRAAIAHSLGGAAVALAMNRGFEPGRVVLIAVPGDSEIYTAPLERHLGLTRRTVGEVRRRVEERLGMRWDDFDVRLAARDLSTPVLVVHDQADTDIPWRHGAAVAAAWPGAVLHTTEGLGHRRILKDPDVVQRTVAFLKEGSEPARAGRKGLEAACPYCGRPAGDWDEEWLLCDACALERTLFVPESRWVAAGP
jgi:pimeloyl-ACP methyl ester carboxylesterase